MSEFAVSMMFGAIIIVLFSWDQFKTPSYQGGRDIMRIAANLTPPEMCNDAVYLRSFAFYTLVLLLIYMMTTLFATAPIVQLLGLLPGNPDGNVGLTGYDAEAARRSAEALRSPIGPLAVSLMMVGLAPKAPFLQRIEEQIRLIAHRLSGIPTRLVEGAQRLRARPLELPEGEGRLLIPAGDWQRLRLVEAFARRIDRGDRFLDDLRKIVAFRAWFLETPAPLLKLRRYRPGMEARTEALKAEIAALLDAIDAFGVAIAPRFAGAGREPNETEVELERRLIAKYSDDAAKLAADVCAMLTLHREHGTIDRQAGDEPPSERQAAAQVLANFLSSDAGEDERPSIVGSLAWRATLTVCIFSFVWGALFGSAEGASELYAIAAGASVAVSGLVIYSPAIIVALLMYARQAEGGSDPWPNLFVEDWAHWMGPFARVALATTATALACGVALNLYWQIGKVGLGPVIAAFWPGAREALLFEGPLYMVGPILALGIVASVDAWRASEDAASRRRRGLAVLAATVVTMALWAAIARGLATQYAAFSGGNEIPALTEICFRDNLMLLAAIRAALIGTVALVVCQRTLSLTIGRHGPPAVSAASGLEASPRTLGGIGTVRH